MYLVTTLSLGTCYFLSRPEVLRFSVVPLSYSLSKFFSFSAETGLTTRENPEKLLGRFGALETRLPETRRKRQTFSSYLGESVDCES